MDYSHKGLARWQSSQEGNALKQILAWLKAQGLRPRFGHADPQTTLLPQLSVLDNLLLALEEGEVAGLEGEKTAVLHAHLEAQGLSGLMAWIPDWSRRARDLGPGEQCLAAICHALLRSTPLTVIELGHSALEALLTAQLKQVLQAKAKERHVLLVLSSPRGWEEVEVLSTHRERVARVS